MLVWQYFSVRTKYDKGRFKSWLLTCSSNITFSLPSYTGSALKRGLNFCNSYLSLLYFCLSISFTLTSFSSSSEFFVSFSFWESMIKIFYDKKKNRCSVYKNKKNYQHWRLLLENVLCILSIWSLDQNWSNISFGQSKTLHKGKKTMVCFILKT